MAPKTDDISVVAELTLVSSAGQETVLSLDTAWHRALTLPTPVHIHFNGFIRKD